MVKFIHNSVLPETIVLNDGSVYAPSDDDRVTKTLPKVVKDVLAQKAKLKEDEEAARKAELDRLAKEADALLKQETGEEEVKPAG